MIKDIQPQIPLTRDEKGNLQIDNEFVDLFYKETERNWKLVRERDGMTKYSRDVLWVEWQEDGTFREQFKEIAIGRSLIMSPFNEYYTWMTTALTEILGSDETFVKFRTNNSIYTLYKTNE